MKQVALFSLPLLLLAAGGCGDLPGSPGGLHGAAGGSAGNAADPSSGASSGGVTGSGSSTEGGEAGAPGTERAAGDAASEGSADAQTTPYAASTSPDDASAACLPPVGSGSCPISMLGTALPGPGAQFKCEGQSLTECHAANTPPALGGCAPQFKPASESRCTITTTAVNCSHVMSTIGGREVDSQVPLGTPPPNGWPAVVLLQASLYPPSSTWSGDAGGSFGIFNYLLLEAMLLDNGFAVIEPTADNNGNFWDTNFPNYGTSGDATFMPVFLDAIKAGTFGPIDRARLFATGMSSGGFMTSRMAVTYPGWFVALAVQSGGYASCAGGIACSPTLPLPADHPPTLFLHGALDIAVPVSDAENYYQSLVAQGTQTEIIVDAQIIHEVLKIAPQAVTCWFLQHDKVHP